MAQEAIIDLDNHINKCRCCLKEFDEEDIQIKITKIVEERFQTLTQIEVNRIFFLKKIIHQLYLQLFYSS